MLDVVLTDSAGIALVELHTSAGGLLGTLTTSLDRLLPCLDGHAYVAEVTDIAGGAVQVRVRAA